MNPHYSNTNNPIDFPKLENEMNQRIKELATQAREYTEKYNSDRGNKLVAEEWTEVYNQKFAELIVRECVDIAYKFDEPKLSGPGMIIGNRIEEHFGVGMSTEDKKTLIKELLGVKND